MKKLLCALLLLVSLASCNVQEWPEDTGERYPFALYLDFDADLPLHKEVYYTRNGEPNLFAAQQTYDIRYIVNVYNVADAQDNNRFVAYTFTFSRPYVENHNYRVELSLPEGKYRFRVWSDHVGSGSQNDLFYSTSDFTEIKIDESAGHPGSNEMRDAFRGSAYGEVFDPELYTIRHGVEPANTVTVPMQRPMGRYEFISTDMDEFLDKAIANLDADTLDKLLARARSKAAGSTRGDDFWNGLTRDEVAEILGLSDYKVTFSYNAFMPSTYNLYFDRPTDSSTGIRYESKMNIGDSGMQLGFDYILVDDETTMNMNMAIYNPDGELIASTSGVEVPIARSKNTVVKGTFLTVTSGGGVGINPDFDGDYNIEIR